VAELPKAPVKRIIERGGASRISADAVDSLRDNLEKKASDITKKAIKEAKKEGRKTVKKRDVMSAKRR